MIEVLNKLHASGDLDKLFQSGLITYKVLLYRDMVNDYDVLTRVKKKSKGDAVDDISGKYNVTRATTYRAIRTLCKSE